MHIEKYKPKHPILTTLESDPKFKYKIRKAIPKPTRIHLRVPNFPQNSEGAFPQTP